MMPLIKTDNQPATKEQAIKDVQPRDAKGNWTPPDVSDVKNKEFVPRPGFKQPNRPAYDKKVFLNTSMLVNPEDKERREKTAKIMQERAAQGPPQPQVIAKKKPGRPPRKD
jgi:hypothetical protein